MQIVIDIDEKIYNDIRSKNEHGKIFNAVKNGKPLPKGHGRLIDVDKVISDGISKGFCDWYDEMKSAPTIIDAESEGNA